MKTNMRITASLFLAAFIACSSQAQTDYTPILKKLKPKETSELLLLGIQNYKLDASLYTVVFDYKKGVFQELENAGHLAVPQGEEMWYMQMLYNTTVIPDTIENYLELSGDDNNDGKLNMELSQTIWYTSKDPAVLDKYVEANINNAVALEGGLMEEQSQTSLMYIANGFVSYEHTGSGFSGGAHPYYIDYTFTLPFAEFKEANVFPSNFFATLPAQTPVRNNQPKTVFRGGYADKDWAKIESELVAIGETGNFEDGEGVSAGVDLDRMTALIRHKQGAVYPTFIAYAPAAYVEQNDYQYTAAYAPATPLPNTLIPNNTLPFDFNELLKLDNEIRDVYLSPNQNVLIITKEGHKDTSTLFIALDTRTGKELSRWDVEGGIVMAEWASGSTAENWKKQLAKGQ